MIQAESSDQIRTMQAKYRFEQEEAIDAKQNETQKLLSKLNAETEERVMNAKISE